MLDEIGRYICHQLPGHSLFINGNQLFVCARDTGVYLGVLFALLMIYVLKEHKHRDIDIRLILLLVLPLAVDGTSQLLGLWEGSNPLRVATGLLAGTGIGYLLVTPLLGGKEGKFPSRKGLVTGIGFSLSAYLFLVHAIPVYLDTQLVFSIVNLLVFAGFLSATGVLAYSSYRLADNIYKRRE